MSLDRNQVLTLATTYGVPLLKALAILLVGWLVAKGVSLASWSPASGGPGTAGVLVQMAFVLLALSVPASRGDELPPGTRVRVTLAVPDTRPRVGVYGGVRDEHLFIRFDDESGRIPLTAIRRIEVSRGRHPSVRGGLLGASLGGLAGALAAGCLANRDDYGVPCAGQDDTKFLVGGIIGGLAGGALGALVGRQERWEDAAPWPSAPPASPARERTLHGSRVRDGIRPVAR